MVNIYYQIRITSQAAVTSANLATNIDNVLVRQNKTQDSERCSWKKAV